MTTISQMRTALAAQLVTALGIRQAYDVEPSNVNLPCAIITKVSGDYEQNLGGGSLTLYQIEVVLLAKGGDPERDQRALDVWLSPATAVQIETGNLGGAVDLIQVKRFRDSGTIARGGVVYTGAFIDVEVWAR